MSNSTYNQLTANLELLKLTQMKLHLDEIRDFVTTNGLSFTEGLLKLSSYEVDFKGKRSNPCTYKYSEKFDITIIIQLHKLYDFNKLYNSYNYHKFFRGL